METQTNPRWLAYCSAHGRKSDAQLAHDEREFPGGCMTGFILWINEQKAEFYKSHPEAFLDRWSIMDQAAWDHFLGV